MSVTVAYGAILQRVMIAINLRTQMKQFTNFVLKKLVVYWSQSELLIVTNLLSHLCVFVYTVWKLKPAAMDCEKSSISYIAMATIFL